MRLRIAGDGGFETTVDQTLMRGLDTARPRFRLGPASVSSGASISSATESQRGLPYRAPVSGDAQMFSSNAWSLPAERGGRSGRHGDGVVGRDRPDEGREFARDRDANDICRLSPQRRCGADGGDVAGCLKLRPDWRERVRSSRDKEAAERRARGTF